jgi:S1-C subfamily serine protease
MLRGYFYLMAKHKLVLKYLYFLSILIFISGCASTQIAVKNRAYFSKYKKVYLINLKNDPRKIIPKVAKHLEEIGFEVVMVPYDEPLGGMQGTGFVITEDGYVLTSAHVLNKKDNATIWINGKRYEAELVYKEARQTDQSDDSQTNKDLSEAMQSALNSKGNRSIYELLREKDLALLKIKLSKHKFKPLIFAREPLYKMGDEIYTIGFPMSNVLGDAPRLNKGFISSSVGLKDSPDYVQVSAEIQPGNSGSPLLNSNGQVIGLIQMTLSTKTAMDNTGGILPQNVNFAIKTTKIKEFINNCPCKNQIVIQEGGKMDFNDVTGSIVQIRSGIIPIGFKDEPKLVCGISYLSFWDLWYRFQYFDIVFVDFDTQEVLLRAGQYKDNPFSNEDGTLNNVFNEIKSKIGYHR